MSSSTEVFIVSAKRTPIGAFLGALAPMTAVQLGSAAIKAAIESAGVKAAELDEVIMGCVLPAGLGQAPRGRQPWALAPRSACRARRSTRCAGRR